MCAERKPSIDDQEGEDVDGTPDKIVGEVALEEAYQGTSKVDACDASCAAVEPLRFGEAEETVRRHFGKLQMREKKCEERLSMCVICCVPADVARLVVMRRLGL